jgi:hypothetical protein
MQQAPIAFDKSGKIPRDLFIQDCLCVNIVLTGK